MERQINIDLLKEYIKTLIATQVVFPGILPRQWGNEFSRCELQTIYFSLKFVLKTAGTKNQKVLIEAFRRVEGPDLNMHWFLCNSWEEIVQLLAKYPNSPMRKPPASSLN